MLNYHKINNIFGWLVFLIATIVYWLTVEQTASYWDCGEFIAVSYKLEVPHPPGAPLFLLIGRMFSFLAGSNTTQVAYWINISSVLSSGFTIMFLFWSITLLGKKLFGVKKGEETNGQTFLLMGGALIGALAYTFSDSFWFSAEEAEVYAMSSFFTAFVVWAILKWENMDDERQANRWIILICYMMGLSIGVHLLNLVTIPALGLVYYFKKYEPSRKGIIIALLISAAILFFINDFIIPGLPSLAGWFEINLVNTFGLPFGTGIVLFVLIIIGAVVYGVYYSNKKQNVLLNTAMLGLVYILIGYSSYAIIVIRSNYNPPIDENNPENIVSFVSYLKREQYGYRPLVHGQYFDAKVVNQKQGDPVYVKGEDSYEITDYKLSYEYDPNRSTIIPRMYSNDPRHIEEYRNWAGLKKNETPNFADNIYFVLRYQVGHMYLRYFMWNFAGRESDIQGADWLSPADAFKDVPEVISDNKGRNNYFMLPLILGLIGLFFQYSRDQKSFAFVAMLFVLTGVALVLYLNSPPVEPRERDYIYVGSFYAFAMWIGFGAMGITTFLQKYLNIKTAAIVSTAICLAVPTIMAAEGWDDHDRSNRYFSVDSAKNFLASCGPNAILFTGGDNDTFPLWYAQEVEGFRTDVRVIVLSYFNTDWYIDQMKRRAYESEPLPFSLEKEHYRQGGLNDYLPLVEKEQVKDGINLDGFLRLVRQNSPAIQVPTRFGKYNSVPTRNFVLNVDTAAVKKMGIVPENKYPHMTRQMLFRLKRGGLEKNTLMILDLIANNNWERPIYFNNTSLNGAGVNLNPYVVQEGNAYRLLPVRNPNPRSEFVNTEVMYENMTENFFYRELDNPNVYYNMDYRNFALNHRTSFNTLASALISEDKMEKAREVLLKSIETIPDESIPFDYSTAQTVSLLYLVGEIDKGREIAQLLARRADELLEYVHETGYNLDNVGQKNLVILSDLTRTMDRENETELKQEFEEIFQKHYARMQ
ncbi:MAG TPA: DUF2723 domain-containing protein [Cytophagales bacterium]|jgi:MFS family permease|nr:DUF2723 domain-containing protein [Cytophagales bacterium]